MKVLLINPPYPFEECPTPPLGLMSLAGFLLAKGIDVKIEDYIITPYSKKRVSNILHEFDPDVIGATGVTMNINTSLRILKDYKEAKPSAKTVMGGPHVTFDAENILSQNSHIEYVVRGEGEITFQEFLEALKSKKSPNNLPGISCRAGEIIIHNPDRPFIEDINMLPSPARHLVQLSKYKAMNYPLNMVTSRGCPHECIFCVGRKMVGGKVRYFDVKRVVDEFEMLSRMGFNQINVVDDLFTSNKKRCMAICDEILKREIKHKWNAFSRVDTISRDLLVKMKEAGCTGLCFGIESGSQEILNIAKKKTTLEKIRKAIDLCRETGMEPMASYIMGLPGETSETIEKSLKFAKELCSNYGFHILAPFPGTEVRENCGQYNIKILTDDWDKYDANRSITDNGCISPEEINAIADRFYRFFKEYVNSILEKHNRGEILSDKDKSFIDNLSDFGFSLDVISGELIESYPGLNSCDTNELINDITHYIVNKSKYNESETKKQISRLINLKCIKPETGDNNSTIVWC